ncbi:prefoldin subunit [Thermovibrio guaymasensis]|uniref:Prefoldin subunit n=1 Tax=Thermovibrio guaymasensis TaxID=240167 RepID=A0A420W8J8_9BACT|nr:prefoldin subunit [Thermovibrio guaymasensis]RKQ63643.1 prefoldin subunit [Thermovibrio guaymasensis]
MKERKSKEEVAEFLKNLPEGRKIYYRFGNLMVEVSKEEALKLLEREEEGEE